KPCLWSAFSRIASMTGTCGKTSAGAAESGVIGGRATVPATKTRSMEKVSRVRASAAYLALIRAFPLRPLRSEQDLDQAIAMVDKLLARRKPLTAQEQDYLES